MPDQPTTIPIPMPKIPHSMLCDAAFKEFLTMRPETEKCTCAAGLLRLIGGGK